MKRDIKNIIGAIEQVQYCFNKNMDEWDYMELDFAIKHLKNVYEKDRANFLTRESNFEGY